MQLIVSPPLSKADDSVNDFIHTQIVRRLTNGPREL